MCIVQDPSNFPLEHVVVCPNPASILCVSPQIEGFQWQKEFLHRRLRNHTQLRLSLRIIRPKMVIEHFVEHLKAGHGLQNQMA